MAAISVIICCGNSEATLGAACESVAWADELMVVDSGSTDRTAEIAERYADRYVVESWRGYTQQKRFAADLAAHDWIFFLDSDEEAGDGFEREWRAISPERLEEVDLWWVPRRNYVMGRPVRAWWPDRLSRVFHRERCTWGGEALHDTRAPSHPKRQANMQTPILHKRLSNAGFGDYFCGGRLDERLLMVAREEYARGKRCRWHDLLFRPWLAFFKSLVIKRGILDGTWGLMIAQKTAVTTQLRYAALWAVQEESDRAIE